MGLRLYGLGKSLESTGEGAVQTELYQKANGVSAQASFFKLAICLHARMAQKCSLQQQRALTWSF